MTPYNTGKVQIGILFDPRRMPPVDEPWQRLLLDMKPNAEQQPPAPKRRFFNALPRHIRGLAAHRNRNKKGLETA